MGAYDLQPDQALVVDGTSPECVFWNLCLWNPFLHTYDYTYERVTINGAHVTYEPDGSWRIVISDTDPGHPNWVSTAGRAERTDLAALVPSRGDPGTARRCRVVDVRLNVTRGDRVDPRRHPARRSGRSGVSRAAAQPMRDGLAAYGATLQLRPGRDARRRPSERTGLDNWGDPAFRERLEVLCASLRDEAGLSDTGVGDGLRTAGGQPGQSASAGGADRPRTPRSRTSPIERPIIICGLPRTGTTHLHNLLAADPSLRYLPYWESLEPFPLAG